MGASSFLLCLKFKSKDMESFYVMGIDISKKKLDYCLMLEGKVVEESVTANHPKAVCEAISSLCRDYDLDIQNLLICAEHTGQYSYPLVCASEHLRCKLWLENPTQIKYSSGMHRGKNDRVDARRIAMYASRFKDKIRVYNVPDEEIERLKQLESELSMLVVDRAKYQGQLTDMIGFMKTSFFLTKEKRLRALIKGLDDIIESIEQEIAGIISCSELLRHQMRLLTSIEGIGPKVALKTILETHAFTRFDNPRQFCCHAGVAPFSYTSGSSQHSRKRVSHKAKKSIKTLLHMAALSVIRQKQGDLKAYYLRKVAEGKNKMTVINAIRAKLVARMFAVIKNNKPYQLIYQNKFA